MNPRTERSGRSHQRHTKPRILTRTLVLTALLAPLLAACATLPPTATPTALPPTPRPTATRIHQTPEPRRTLVLCTTEPQAASPFVPSQSGSDLLALFYEEPLERVAYTWEPRLVTHLPSLESGDMITRSVNVIEGMRYVDAMGLIQTYTETETFRLPQMVVTFTLKPDLRWSDGVEMQAKDAVLGYHLAQAPEAQGRWQALAERTAKFIAVDQLTLRWEGLPGYLDADYAGFLFPLQPSDRWQGQTLDSILRDRTPPASGPFGITAWESGREVRLLPNEHYEGDPPHLEEIIVRFPQQAYSGWHQLLANGTCDVVLPDPIMVTPWDRWARLGATGEAIIWADAAPAFLRLDMNLDPRPRAMDDNGAPRPHLLGDIRMRQAITACINRDLMARTMRAEAIAPATDFIPPSHPAAPGSATQTYAPSQAQAWLQELGWRDVNGNGARAAQDIPGIPDGYPLRLRLHFASEYFAPAAYIAADLEACGFDIELQPTDRRQLYAVSSHSPLFGRQFELALVGWQAQVPEICGAWFSHRIPNEENGWLGENFSGFASADYDAACEQALAAVTKEQQRHALQTARRLLEEVAPTTFLAWRPFWFAARPDVQGLQPDASAYGTIWNAEALWIGTVEDPD
jgi:peptide/nickel transport system substrate-binding protein